MTQAPPATADERSLADFIGKWRARWPEWHLAEVFVPVAQRPVALAWAALQQELLDAAWAGSDARPGEAKLLWWQEELAGWSQGRRRHPLGATLQRLPAPWEALALALPALGMSRERPRDLQDALATLQPVTSAAAGVEAALLIETASDHAALVGATWLAQRMLLPGDAGVPLSVLATSPSDPTAAWRRDIASTWPESASGPRVRRLWATLARSRLTLSHPTDAPAAWRTLIGAWRAARN